MIVMNKLLVTLGIAIIAVTSGALLFVEEDLGIWPVVIGWFGIFALTVGLKKRKNDSV